MRKLCGAVAVVLGLVTSAWADFESGKAAYDRGDYATALEKLQPLAEQGDAKAQTIIGYMYVLGKGLAQDHAEGAQWFRKAAEQGDANAQDNLGSLYYLGRGVPQDYTEAAKWFRKAAEQGYASGHRHLGSMYYLGQGVPLDFVQAHTSYNLAAALSSGEIHDAAVMARNGVEGQMTPAQIAEAEKLAREWIEKHQKAE